MQFWYKDKEISLQGEDMLSKKPIKEKSINKMLTAQSIYCLFQLQVVTKEEGSNSNIPTTIQSLLKQYNEVITEPKKLPP